MEVLDTKVFLNYFLFMYQVEVVKRSKGHTEERFKGSRHKINLIYYKVNKCQLSNIYSKNFCKNI